MLESLRSSPLLLCTAAFAAACASAPPSAGPAIARGSKVMGGDVAWNNVAPGPRFVNDRAHQLWITPHGVLKAAQRNTPH